MKERNLNNKTQIQWGESKLKHNNSNNRIFWKQRLNQKTTGYTANIANK